MNSSHFDIVRSQMIPVLIIAAIIIFLVNESTIIWSKTEKNVPPKVI